MDFILRYPQQFEQHDQEPLRVYRDAVNAALPRWGRRATACSDDISQCGFAADENPPVRPVYPKRLQSADPLTEKWEWILDRDDLISAHFDPRNLGGRTTKDDWQPGPNGTGRYILFRFDEGRGEPCAGLYYHPDFGAYGVGWTLFRLYHPNGGPFGPHGFPVSDETYLSAEDGYNYPSGVYFFDGTRNWNPSVVSTTWRRQTFQQRADWRRPGSPDRPDVGMGPTPAHSQQRPWITDNLVYGPNVVPPYWFSVWQDGYGNPPDLVVLDTGSVPQLDG